MNETVLIVSGDAGQVDDFKVILGEYQLEVVGNGAGVLSYMARQGAVGAVVVGRVAGEDGIDLFEQFKQASEFYFGLTPFILIDRQEDSPERLARATKLGLDGYLEEPLCPADLLAMVQACLKARQGLAQALAGKLPAEDVDFEINLLVKGHELTVNTRHHHIQLKGLPIHPRLTPTEILLLECLAEQPNQKVSITDLYLASQPRPCLGINEADRRIALQVSALRRKLNTIQSQLGSCIETIPATYKLGRGYLLRTVDN